MNFEKMAEQLVKGPALEGTATGLEASEVARLYQSSEHAAEIQAEREQLVFAAQAYMQASLANGGSGEVVLVVPVFLPGKASDGGAITAPCTVRVGWPGADPVLLAGARALGEQMEALAAAVGTVVHRRDTPSGP